MKANYTVSGLKELDVLCDELHKTIILQSENFKNQIFFLEAEMGSGKTTFIRKLIREFNSEIKVTSPTFTGMHLYSGIEYDFYHYDLYQVGLNLEEFEDILEDKKNKLIFFEWAENLDIKIKNRFLNSETSIYTIKIDVNEKNEERFFQIT